MRFVCYGADVPVELDEVTDAWAIDVLVGLGKTQGCAAILSCELLNEGHCAVQVVNLVGRCTLYFDGHDHCILTRRYVTDVMPPPELLPHFHPDPL